MAVVFAQQSRSTPTTRIYSGRDRQVMKNTGVLITTHAGTFTIELYPKDAPNTVHNFIELVKSGYYDGMVFHRIIPGLHDSELEIQIPRILKSDRSFMGATGGSGHHIQEEFNTLQHDRGIISMARGTPCKQCKLAVFHYVHEDSQPTRRKIYSRLED